VQVRCQRLGAEFARLAKLDAKDASARARVCAHVPGERAQECRFPTCVVSA
jgi:hypothetical protein